MKSNAAGKSQPSRKLFVIGTSQYTSPEFEDRDGIPNVLEGIVGLLTTFNFHIHFAPSGYLLNPHREMLRDKIRQARLTADLVVIYYTGHGEHINNEGHHLITKEFTKTELPEAGVKVVDLPALIAARTAAGDIAQHQAPTLIVLDCCFSGAGAIDLLQDALLEKRTNPAYADLWVWATAGNLQWANSGLFPAALAEALTNTTIGPSTPELPLMTVLDHVNGTLKNSAADQQSEIIPPNGRLTSSPPFFANLDYSPNVAGVTVDAQHWRSKARGTENASATGFYLTGHSGRAQAAQDLVRWIIDPTSRELAVVTGSPGTGKSTLLALPALLTEEASRNLLLRQTTADSLVHKMARLLPETTAIFSVHARGLNIDQIAARIAADLARPAKGAAALLAILSEQPTQPSPVVLIDAVDEATNPVLVRDRLLIPLVQHGIRVVLGTRRHILPLPDITTTTIDLDIHRYHDPDALTDYIGQLLVAAHEPDVATPYQASSGRPQPDIPAISAAIAARATSGQVESFMIARVIAIALRARPEPLDLATSDWATQLPAGLGDAFEEDLARLELHTPSARVLLEALAWARGPGLPWETLWVPVAQALAQVRNDVSQHLRISDEDVRALLTNGGAYVVEDLGPGKRSVFRPFHELLTEHLRTPPVSTPFEQVTTSIENAITKALLGTVPTDRTEARRWDRAHPYLHSYLVEHAHAGSEHFDELLNEGGFLATADPTTLTPLLVDAAPDSEDIARSYRRVLPQLGDDPQANIAYLNEAAIAVQARPIVTGKGLRPLYVTRWSSVRADNSQLTLTGHARPLRAVAFGSDAHGHSILASACDRGIIRLWNPDTGTEIGDPLTAHTSAVWALAFSTTTDGRPILASAGNGGIVRLWDLTTEKAIAEPLRGHRGPVWSLAFGTTTDGGPILASAGDDGTVRLWNPDTGGHLGDPLRLHQGPVRALAFGTASRGRPFLATAGDDGTVRLRTPNTGKAIGDPLRGHRGPARILAFGTTSNGRPILASAGTDGTVRLWDPDNGKRIGEPLKGHRGPVRALAFGSTGGQALIASASDGSARLWNADTGKMFGNIFKAHTRPVKALAFGTTVDGSSLLASAGDDRTIRLWNFNADNSIGNPPQKHRGPVRALALSVTAGSPGLLASAGDTNIQLWNPETGKPIGNPIKGHTRPVKTLAFGTTVDGSSLLASAGDDRTIRLWNPNTGKPIGNPIKGHRGTIWSLVFGATSRGRHFLASAGSDCMIRFWDPDTTKAIGYPFKVHRGPVWAVAFGTTASIGPFVASAGDDRTIRLWNPNTGKPIGNPLKGHRGPIRTLSFTTTNSGAPLLASAGDDRTIRLWDPNTGKPIGNPLKGHRGPIRTLSFTTTNSGVPLLASAGDDRTIQLRNVETGKSLVNISRRIAPTALLIHKYRLTIGDDDGISMLELNQV